MFYSVIVPCYKSAATIRKVVEMTMAEFARNNIPDYEFVLVDDSSPDQGATVSALESLADDYGCVRIIELARNSGQHNAVMAGLNYTRGDAIICMDDDLQTHPSQLPLLLEEFHKGYDIVYGYYPQKKHSSFRNFGSYINHLSVRILIGKPKDMRTSSFWIIRKFVRDYAIEYKSQYTHLQGLFLRTTRNISCIPVQHFEREVGTSGYTFKKLIALWSNIMGYSIVPLRMATYCGYFFSGIGLLGTLFAVARKLIRPATAIGWPSVMAAICFFAGINLLFLGLIGEYLGRMFLSQSRYPQYVIRCIYTQDGMINAHDYVAETAKPDAPKATQYFSNGGHV